ncbi:hypothetical protein As57867_007118, partial [Aphanomyces stellatus]
CYSVDDAKQGEAKTETADVNVVDNAYLYAIFPTVVATLLPVATMIMDWHIQALYPQTARFLPLAECCRLDAARRIDPEMHKQDSAVYVQPAMQESAPLEPNISDLVLSTDLEASYGAMKDSPVVMCG